MTSDDKYLEDSTYDAILAAVAVALRCIPAKALTHGIQQLDRREIVGPLVNPSAWLASNGFKAHRLAMKTLQGALVMSLFALGSAIVLTVGPWLWLRLRQFDAPGSQRGAWGVRLAGAALCASSGWALWMGLVEYQAPWCLVP